MRFRVIFFFILYCYTLSLFAQPKAYKQVVKLMGSPFEFTAVHTDSLVALQGITAGIREVQRINDLISTWQTYTQATLINKQAGIRPVQVDKEVFDLIVRCQKISELTDGAFDITFAPLNRIWRFDGSMTQMPSDSMIQATKQKVNWRKIRLNADSLTVFLPEKGMEIGFGAIGQGYAVNRAKKMMQNAGIENGLVNGSGDILAWGKNENNQDWVIGIGNPKQPEKSLAWLKINDLAITTSGDYEHFVWLKGKKYSHIINPQTGYPAQGIQSVTVVCPDAELADALDTAIFVLGEEKGLALVNQLNGINCLIINEKGEIKTSKNLQLNFYKRP